MRRCSLGLILVVLGCVAGCSPQLQATPVSPVDELISEGQAAYRAGDFQAALDAYEQALVLDPDSTDAYIGLIDVHTILDDREAVIEDANFLIEAEAGNLARTYTQRGTAYLYLGDMERALEDLNMAFELGEDSSEAYTNRAIVHFTLGNLDEAEADAEQAVSLNSANGNAHYTLGQIRTEAGDFEGALEAFLVASEIGPYPNIDWYIGNAYHQLGEDELAFQYLPGVEFINEPSPTPEFTGYGDAAFDVGREYLEEQNFEAAVGAFEEALQSDPENPELLYLTGQAFYGFGDFVGAASFFDMAFLRDPNNPDYAWWTAHAYDRAVEGGFFEADEFMTNHIIDSYMTFLDNASADDPRLEEARERIVVLSETLP